MRVLIVFVSLVLLSGCRPARIEQGQPDQPQAAVKDRPAQADNNQPKAPGQGQLPKAQQAAGPQRDDRFPPGWDVQAAAFSPDGKTLLVGYHYGLPRGLQAMRLEYWEVASGTLLWSRSGTDDLAPILVLPGAKEALVGGQKSVQLWNLAEGRQLKVLFRDERGLNRFTATPSGKVCLAYTGRIPEITAFEVPSGKWTGQVTLLAHLVSTALSPDGCFVLCAMNPTVNVPHTVELWSLLDRRLVQGYTRDQGYKPVALSADGKLAVRGFVVRPKPQDGREGLQLVVWETLSGKERARVKTWGESVAFLADGQILAIEDRLNRTLTRTEWTTGRVLSTLKLPKDHWVRAISPDDRWVLTANGGGKRLRITLSLWDLNTGQHVRNLERPDVIDQ